MPGLWTDHRDFSQTAQGWNLACHLCDPGQVTQPLCFACTQETWKCWEIAHSSPFSCNHGYRGVNSPAPLPLNRMALRCDFHQSFLEGWAKGVFWMTCLIMYLCWAPFPFWSYFPTSLPVCLGALASKSLAHDSSYQGCFWGTWFKRQPWRCCCLGCKMELKRAHRNS